MNIRQFIMSKIAEAAEELDMDVAHVQQSHMPVDQPVDLAHGCNIDVRDGLLRLAVLAKVAADNGLIAKGDPAELAHIVRGVKLELTAEIVDLAKRGLLGSEGAVTISI